jgi:hypothetical protein
MSIHNTDHSRTRSCSLRVAVGQHATSLKVPFLNYMANIRNRAGHGALVRIGGNTQESATLYTQGTVDGSMIEKIKEEGAAVVSPGDTPSIEVLILYTC